MHQVEQSPTLSSASLAPSSPPPLDYGSPLTSPLISPLHLPNVRPSAVVPALPIESVITKPTSPPGLQGKAIVNPNRPATSTVIRQSSPPAVSNALRFSAGVTQMNQSVLTSRSMQVHLPESRAFTKASIAAASAVAAHATAMLASIDAIAVRPSCLSQAESRSPEAAPLHASPGHQSPRIESMSPVQFTSAFSARNAESSFHFNKLQLSPIKATHDSNALIPQKSPKSFTSLTERTFVNATPADSVNVRKTFWSGSESPEPTPRQADTSKNTRNLAALKLKLNHQSGVMLSARPYEPVGTMPSTVEVTHSLSISDNQNMSALESARALIALHSPGSRSTVAYVHDLPKPTKTVIAPEIAPISNTTKSSQRPTSAATSVSICIPTVESQFQMPSAPALVPEIPFSRVVSVENRPVPELLSRIDSKTPSILLHSISTLPRPLAHLVSSLNLEQCTADASNDLNFNRFQTEFVKLESEERQAVANKAVPQCLAGSKVQPSAPLAPPPPKIPSRLHRRVVQRADTVTVSSSLTHATQPTQSTNISIAAAKIVHQTAGSSVSAPLVERALTRRFVKALEQPKHNRPVAVEEPIPEIQRAQIRVSRADKLRAAMAAVSSSEIVVPKYQPSVLCDQIGLSSRVFNTEPVRLLDSFKPVTHTPSTPRSSLMNVFPIPAKSTPRTSTAFEIVGQSAPKSRNPYRLPMTSSMRRHHPQLTGHIMRRHTSFAPHASRPELLLGALNEIQENEAATTNESAPAQSAIQIERSREASRSSSALSSNSIRAGSVPRSMFESAIMTASASVAAMTAPMTAAESRIEPVQPNRATRSGISTPRTRESPIKMDSESDVGSPHAPGPGPYLSARKLFRALSNLLPREDEDEPPLPEAECTDVIELVQANSEVQVISTPQPELNPIVNESIAPTEMAVSSAELLAVEALEKS